MVVGDDHGQNDINRASLTNSLNDVMTTSNQDASNSTSAINNAINSKVNEDLSQVAKWAIGFEKLLEDPIGLHVFTVNIEKILSVDLMILSKILSKKY